MRVSESKNLCESTHFFGDHCGELLLSVLPSVCNWCSTGEAELTLSALIPPDIFFSSSNKHRTKIRTLKSGFSEILETNNREKGITCRLRTKKLCFLFLEHEAYQWDALRLSVSVTAWTAILEQCRYTSTACTWLITTDSFTLYRVWQKSLP